MDIQTLRLWFTQRDSISHLETIDVFSGTRTLLHTFDFVIEAPNWTRDGRYLVYNAHGRLFTFELKTGAITEINTDFAIDCNNDHVLSPDNTELAISHFTNDDATSRIYIVPFTGGQPRLVTEKGPSYLHGWSPDGQHLTYCAERTGQYDIYTIRIDGSDETQLTNNTGLDDGPEYSPDGQYIWFNSTRTGLMQVWRMRNNGSEPTHMVKENANCWFPHVSPDGKWVIYIAYDKEEVKAGDHPPNKNVELRLIPIEGGVSKTIVKLFGGQGTINVNSWAPDNRTIAFVSYQIKP